MNRRVSLSLALVFGGALLAPAAFAASIPIGFVSFDVTGPDVAQFDINNETGINSSGDATFPVTTSVSLANLSLDIKYLTGPDLVFNSSSGYFSLSPDGISWTGTALSTTVGQGSDGLLGSFEAILTGTLSPTSLTLYDGSTADVGPSFSATIVDPAGLADGDLAVIYALPPSTTVTPEPETFVMVGSGLLALLSRRRNYLAAARNLFSRNVVCAAALLVVLLCGSSIAAHASAPVDAVKLNTWANPTSGLAGFNSITVTGSGFPSGAITPGAVTVTFAATCGGAPVATTAPLVVKTVIGSEDQLSEIPIPASLTTGTYYISVSGASNGGVLFNSEASCSEVTVTATSTTIASCVPTSSLAVVAGANVNAFVPGAAWDYDEATGVNEVSLEGSSAPQHFTAGYVNSCAANSVTSEVVCTENNTTVDLINGSTVTQLTSGANDYASFTGGSCYNCGVAINSANNTAMIAGGFSGGSSGQGVQVLNLSNNTFNTPFPMHYDVSEDISIDSGRNLVLSPGEDGIYDLLKIGAGNSLTEYSNNISYGGYDLDSAAEDCTTGIALSANEFYQDIYITDLTQAAFTAGSPGTWTAPGQFFELPGTYFDAGSSGLSSAPGTNHEAVVTGEFGGDSYAILLLPSTSGSGTPTLADWAFVGSMPNTPDGYSFSAGYDPHTVTAYTSPNTGKSYAVFADYELGAPDWLGVVDMACVLGLPRNPGTNTVTDDAAACTRYVAVP